MRDKKNRLLIFKTHKRDGGAGYRSRYLSHAKRALYHLSYAPCCVHGAVGNEYNKERQPP